MSEIIHIPGTNLPYTDFGSQAFSTIRQLIAAAGGFSLSQICAITGLEGSTIQNWVKRGYIGGSLKSKKYNEKQVARILIYNALRGSLQLDEIAKLMEYVNGSVPDLSDDIIEEGDLFSYMCQTAQELSALPAAVEPEHISSAPVMDTVMRITADYSGTDEQSERLRRALAIMSEACLADRILKSAKMLIESL